MLESQKKFFIQVKLLNEQLEKLRSLSIFLGTSSWKYPGWTGLVYKKPFSSEKLFKEECLKEYSEQFFTVGVDHTYYAFPTQSQMERYFNQTPDTFRFVLKATEESTVLKFPKLPRYGKNSGKTNPHFLNPNLFLEKFLEPVRALKNKLGPIIFEFSRFRHDSFQRGSDFVDQLDQFLGELRKSTSVPLAVEIRNKNWLVSDYFEVLTKHKTAHVFNSWTEMPLIESQMALSTPYQLPFSVVRLLLNPGTTYQSAVNAYSPYNKLHQEHVEIRNSTAKLIELAIEQKKEAYILVNNRFEGCAPKTIQGILTLIHLLNLHGD